MRGLILAAGRGSRMAEATHDRPKALVTLGGVALLDWQMAAMRGAGIRELGLVRGYRGAAFDGRGLTLFDNPRWAETNMVASLATARAWLASAPSVVSYADIFYPAEAVRRLMAAEGEIVLGYDPDWLALWSQRFADPLADAETFRIESTGRIDDAGRIREIGGKTRDAADIEGQYVGLFRLTPAGWERIATFLDGLEPAVRDRLDMTGLFRRLIAAGADIRGVAIPGPWGEVDQQSDLALYEAMLARGALRQPALEASRC
ncbi:MAG: phosphocholine cytidylyltransferase family protein [Alphaproteobacteria bacterium]|nr:phosphocholine cytidylyltransferase family protein [Alphaproteobacteria bacterium]